jgi:hypothetical protein
VSFLSTIALREDHAIGQTLLLHTLSTSHERTMLVVEYIDIQSRIQLPHLMAHSNNTLRSLSQSFNDHLASPFFSRDESIEKNMHQSSTFVLGHHWSMIERRFISGPGEIANRFQIIEIESTTIAELPVPSTQRGVRDNRRYPEMFANRQEWLRDLRRDMWFWRLLAPNVCMC